MKGFKLKDNGDISMTDNAIDVIEGTELEIQTMETVLRTNKGEWFFDKNEGINHRQIIGKGITPDMIKTQIQSGINQVSSEYLIEDFSVNNDKRVRAVYVDFTARKLNSGALISSRQTYGKGVI